MKNEKNTLAPHICAEAEIPTLCFAPERYLGWFRGHCFQVSSTQNGVVSLGSSAGTLIRDLSDVNDLPSEIKPLIAFSHMSEAAIPFDEFWDLLAHDPKLVNTFISITDDICGICGYAFDICTIESMIQTIEEEDVAVYVNDPYIFASSKPFICAIQDSTMYTPLGTLILGYDSVQIQDSRNGLAYKISFPDYRCIGDDIKANAKAYYRVMWNRLPWILFCYAEIVLDVTGSRIRYDHSIVETIHKTNQISNKNEFYDFIREALTDLESGLLIKSEPYQ